MIKSGFCEKKFRSLLLTSALTMAVLYLMLLCDSVIAGLFIGASGVAAINAVLPVTSIVTFFATIIAVGSGIVYSREIGAMRKKKADEIFGQGLIISIVLAVISAVALVLARDLYFSVSGVRGEIYDLAMEYYKYTPLNTVLAVIVSYLEDMVYNDGDEVINNASYITQIGCNIVFSIILVKQYGMIGIILGTVIANALGIVVLIFHFFKRSCTLHFVWHLSMADFIRVVRFSIVDAVIYLCWGVMDYVLIGFVSSHYGETGQVTLAVVVNLIEFTVVLDGVGLAIQPLFGTYLGEKNACQIKRLMHEAINAAIKEGLLASVFVFALAGPFCAVFGITGGEAYTHAVTAVRIVSAGMVFCSIVSLMTSYYMLVDHVAQSVEITVLKDGIMYSFLPLLGSYLFGENGMWAAFAAAPAITLALSLAYMYLRYGKERFPYLFNRDMVDDVVVIDEELTPENSAKISERIAEVLKERGYTRKQANMASLFVEEMGLTILEKNGETKKPLLAEVSMIFREKYVYIILRDSGKIFDITDPEEEVSGLSGFVLNGLIESNKDIAYLTTTGYNRNIMKFTLGE